MSVTLSEFFPVVLYILVFALLVVLIVLGIKLIHTLTKVDKVVDDVSIKSRKLNNVFDIIDQTADGLSKVSDIFVNGVLNSVNYIFKKAKKGNKKDEE